MIFCITLFQRAASRVKKRQSGAEDPRLRAACVNRVLCPLVARCRPAHVIGQHGKCVMRGRVAVLRQQAKWYRGVMPLPWQAGAETFVFGVWPEHRSCAEDEVFLRSGDVLCRTAAHCSEPVAE